MCQKKSFYLNRKKTYDQQLSCRAHFRDVKKHDQDDASKPNERRFQPFPRQKKHVNPKPKPKAGKLRPLLFFHFLSLTFIRFATDAMFFFVTDARFFSLY